MSAPKLCCKFSGFTEDSVDPCCEVTCVRESDGTCRCQVKCHRCGSKGIDRLNCCTKCSVETDCGSSCKESSDKNCCCVNVSCESSSGKVTNCAIKCKC